LNEGTRQLVKLHLKKTFSYAYRKSNYYSTIHEFHEGLTNSRWYKMLIKDGNVILRWVIKWLLTPDVLSPGSMQNEAQTAMGRPIKILTKVNKNTL